MMRNNASLLKSIILALLLVTIGACGAPSVQRGDILVNLTVDGMERQYSVSAGSSARQAFIAAGIEVGLLDRSEPPLYTVLTAGSEVRLIRVTEELEIEVVVIPYETQTLRNESLPEGKRRLVQTGENGVQEITYRRLFEDGVEISSSPIQTLIVQAPVPEVVMLGSRALFSPQDIPGTLAYLSGNNAWVMQGSTGVRTPVVATGDLDGRIFSLSPDGVWLLYTRRDDNPDDEVINTLWITRVDGEAEVTIDLKTQNVIHFAAWIPGSNNGISVSTVEFTPNPPGWQANNDLILMYFSESGWVGDRQTILEANSGGLYGWWGINFAWSPDGEMLAYARPDSVGLVDFDAGSISPLVELIPFQTGSDWAWVPGIAWAPDSSFLFTVSHAPQEGLISPEESPLFNLSVIPMIIGAPLSLAPEVGMFAGPISSSSQSFDTGEDYYLVAHLQAISALESRTSGYQLVVRDRDGSNSRLLFPPEGAPGLNPQRLAWSPGRVDGSGYFIALMYQGNLWLIDVLTGQAHQLTGDGFVTALDWR
ncbi:MAG: G5 domain-containing protein [Chloroflexi bacterium]|nr:G5 domain-containing protein [Chloroflexota bacterium]